MAAVKDLLQAQITVPGAKSFDCSDFTKQENLPLKDMQLFGL